MTASITLNGMVTQEYCTSYCGNLITIHHGHDDAGRRKHYQICSECGVSMPRVCYECPGCDAISDPADIEKLVAGEMPLSHMSWQGIIALKNVIGVSTMLSELAAEEVGCADD